MLDAHGYDKDPETSYDIKSGIKAFLGIHNPIDTLLQKINALDGQSPTIKDDAKELAEKYCNDAPEDCQMARKMESSILLLADNGTKTVENYKANLKSCILNLTCKSIPQYADQAFQNDFNFDQFEKRLKQELENMKSRAEECNAFQNVATLDKLVGYVETYQEVWGEAGAYLNLFSDELLEQFRPCVYEECLIDYNDTKLELYRKVLSVELNEQWSTKYQADQERISSYLQKAHDNNEEMKIRLVAIEGLNNEASDMFARCSRGCGDYLNEAVKQVHAALQSAAKKGKNLEDFGRLYASNTASNIGPIPERPLWFIAAFKNLANHLAARPTIAVPADRIQTYAVGLDANLRLMNATKLDLGELQELKPYKDAAIDLPHFQWLSQLSSRVQSSDSSEEALSTFDALVTILKSLPPTRHPTHEIADFVAEEYKKAWNDLLGLLNVIVEFIFTNSEDAIKASKELQRLLEAASRRLGDTVLHLEIASSRNGLIEFERQSIQQQLVQLQTIITEATAVLKFPNSAICGWNVISTVEISPKEAKLGGLIGVDRFGNHAWMQPIEIPADFITSYQPNVNKPDVSRNNDGLTTIQGGLQSRGKHIVTLKVRGYHAMHQAPSGALYVEPAQDMQWENVTSTAANYPENTRTRFEHFEVRQQDRDEMEEESIDDTETGCTRSGGCDEEERLDHLFGHFLNEMCSFKNISELKETFKKNSKKQLSSKADFDVDNQLKRAFRRGETQTGEYRHPDLGTPMEDDAKFVFRKRGGFAMGLVFPKEEEDYLNRLIYDELGPRFEPTSDAQWRLGTGDPYRASVEKIINEFKLKYTSCIADLNVHAVVATAKGALPETLHGPHCEIERQHRYIEENVDFTCTGASTGERTYHGKGRVQTLYPWRGDKVVHANTADVIETSVNGKEIEMVKMSPTYRLKVTHSLSSYESWTGKASVVLEHPDDKVYYMQINAPPGKYGVFEEGSHVIKIQGLGSAKSSKKGLCKRGELFLVLHSNITVPP